MSHANCPYCFNPTLVFAVEARNLFIVRESGINFKKPDSLEMLHAEPQHVLQCTNCYKASNEAGGNLLGDRLVELEQMFFYPPVQNIKTPPPEDCF